MQILLGVIVGAVVGMSLHFLVPGRDTRGVALAPILGAVVAALVWTALTWAGMGIDNPLIWLSSIVAPALAVTPALIALTRLRTRLDHAEQVRRGIA